jgi:hypothetical protein
MSAPGPELQSVDQLIARLRTEIDRHKAGRVARRGKRLAHDGAPEPVNAPEFSPLALPLFPPLPRKDVYAVQELLAYEDRDFVRAVFQALLRREPDLDGGLSVLSALRSGVVSKVAVIDGVHQSPEAKAIGVQVPGLSLRMKIRKLRRIPVVGKLLAALVSLPQLPGAIDDLYRTSGRAAKLERTLATIQAALGERINILTLADSIEDVQAGLRDMDVRAEKIGTQLADAIARIEQHAGQRELVERELIGRLLAIGETTAALTDAQRAVQFIEQRVASVEERLPQVAGGVEQVRRELDFVRQPFHSPFMQLEQALAAIKRDEPIYRLPGTHVHAVAPDDLLSAVQRALTPFGRKLRLAVFNAGAAYAAFYFAERNNTVTAFDADERMITAGLALRNVNRIPTEFEKRALDPALLEEIAPARFDVGLILRGFENSPDRTELLDQLLERIPVVITALPTGTAAPLLESGHSCTPIGQYIDRDQPRQLFLCTADVVTVNGRLYPVRQRAFIAYNDAPSFCRHYIQSDGVFIKHYLAAGGGAQGNYWYGNLPQILREIVNYNALTSPSATIPRLIDYQISDQSVSLVLEQIPGVNLAAALADHAILPARSIYLAVIDALRQLRQAGLYHNDVRSWNVMVDGDRAWLIDLGLASAKEEDSTLAGLLWLLYDLSRSELSRLPRPLLDPPTRAIHDFHPDLQDIAAALLEANTFDEYLAGTQLVPA